MCFSTIFNESSIFFASRDYIENLNDVFSWCCFLYFLKLNEEFEIHNFYKIHKNVQNICSLFHVIRFKILSFSFDCLIQTCCVSSVSLAVLFSRSVLDKSFLKIRFRFQSEYNEIVIASQSQRVKRRFSDSTKWFNVQWFSRKEKNIFSNFVRTSDFDNVFFIIFCKLKNIVWNDLKNNIMNKVLVICIYID